MKSVEFALDETDFGRLQSIVNRRVSAHVGALSLPSFVQMLAWMFATIPLFTLFRMWKEGAEAVGSMIYLSASLLVAFLLAALGSPWASQRLLAKYALSDRGTFFTKQRIALIDDFIVLKTESTESSVRWTAVIGREEDDRNFYLFVDALQALVVPRHVAQALGAEFTTRYAATRTEA